jgi:hypothetical protein
MSERVRATVFLCPAVGKHGVWSEQAVAGLVGQDVKLKGATHSGKHVQFEATVTAAEIDHGTVLVEIAIPADLYRLAPIDSDWWNETTTGHPGTFG